MSREGSPPSVSVAPASPPPKHSSCESPTHRRSISGRKPTDAVPRAEQMHFSLDQAPPFNIQAPSLLRGSNSQLPPSLRCLAPHYEEDATCREAALFTTHSFWYTFCSMLQPDSEDTQARLLRLMAQHYARLTLALKCDRDVFFEHFPPLVAHAVLAGLRRHSALPEPRLGHADVRARAVLAHLVTLMGGLIPRALVADHVKHAERPPSEAGAKASLSRSSAPPPIQKSFADAHASHGPPLSASPVPALIRCSASTGSLASTPAPTPGSSLAPPPDAWSRLRGIQLIGGIGSAPAGSSGHHRHFIRGPQREQLHPSGQRRSKPVRTTVDLNLQSPLIAIFNGKPPVLPPALPAAGREGGATLASSASLDSLVRGAPIKAGAAMRPVPARLSFAGAPGQRYGGVSTFHALEPRGVTERSAARVAEAARLRSRVDFEGRLVRAAARSRQREIDAACAIKMRLEEQQLSEYAYDLAEGREHASTFVRQERLRRQNEKEAADAVAKRKSQRPWDA